jgi:hypothetical protein
LDLDPGKLRHLGKKGGYENDNYDPTSVVLCASTARSPLRDTLPA